MAFMVDFNMATYSEHVADQDCDFSHSSCKTHTMPFSVGTSDCVDPSITTMVMSLAV